jgi:ammonium transporter Rh
MLGCLFLWAFWPSINAAVFPLNDYERSLVRQNTMLALIGSCLTAFGLSALFRKDHKFDMEDLLNSTLSGGVIIGAASQLFTNTGGALGTGVIGGIISVISYMKISPGLKLCIGLYDTCNAHNLHGIQAVLGGIISGIVIAFYQVVPIDPRLEGLLKFY